MLLIAPLLAFVALFRALWRARCRSGWRDTLLTTALLWGVLLTALTEGLSAFEAISGPVLAVGWLVVALLAGLFAWRQPGRPPEQLSWPTGLERAGLLLGLIGLAAIVLGTGLVVVAGWPNNADGMIYHVARVGYWVQNGSVEFYPSHNSRQLYNPPWAEYGLLQAMLLAGDERAGNLVQWLSMLGCLVGVSLVAAQLGAGWRGQLGAALFCATLPMGILQASSSQNDYVVAFWLVCLVVNLLAEPLAPLPWSRVLGSGAALGLAMLTKGTTYFFAAPLLVLLPFVRTRPGWARLAGQGVLLGAIALAVNAPFYWHSLGLFGTARAAAAPAPTVEQAPARPDVTVTNNGIQLAFLVANLVRNTTLHLGSPIPGADLTIETATKQLLQRFEIDPSDPRTSWKSLPFGVPPATPDEGFAGNTLQQLLIGGASVMLVASWRRRGRALLGLAAAVTLSFVMYSLLIKWQPYGSRLLLPLFVLWAPVIGGLLQALPGRWLALLIVPLVVWSAPYVLTNRAHPLIGKNNIWTVPRVEQYFSWRREELAAALGAVRFVEQRGCRDVGLINDDGDYEYPFWALLRGLPAGSGRVQPVGVTNRTALLSEHSPVRFLPCAVIDQRDRPTGQLAIAGQEYRPGWAAGKLRVLLPAG